MATDRGTMEVVKALLIIDPTLVEATDSTGMTAFACAAENGNLKMAHELLSGGSNPNSQDKNGVTPLMRAVRNNHPEMVKFLVKTAKVNAGISDNIIGTALHYAVNLQDLPMIKLLLKLDPTIINQRNKKGESALDTANKGVNASRNKDIIQFLQEGPMSQFDRLDDDSESEDDKEDDKSSPQPQEEMKKDLEESKSKKPLSPFITPLPPDDSLLLAPPPPPCSPLEEEDAKMISSVPPPPPPGSPLYQDENRSDKIESTPKTSVKESVIVTKKTPKNIEQ